MRPEILFPLFAPVSSLKGTGPKTTPLLEKLAGPLVRDLVFTPPTSLIFRTRATATSAIEGQIQTFEVVVLQHIRSPKPGAPYKVRVSDDTGFMHLIYFKVFGDHLERKMPVGSPVWGSFSTYPLLVGLVSLPMPAILSAKLFTEASGPVAKMTGFWGAAESSSALVG